MEEITTIVVGNGMGMAINAEYFKLEAGINNVLQKLNRKDKKLIHLNCKKLTEEDQLEDHHKVLSACYELAKHTKLRFLTKKGKIFSNVYHNFIYQLAKYFFDFNFNQNDNAIKMFNAFIERLCQYIKTIKRCHIATLNYDKLLYKALVDREILKGYSGRLVGGMFDSGFKSENLNRLHGKTFGWYMHLHGSPLFKTNRKNGLICKSNISNLPDYFSNEGAEHTHIVLSPTKRKPSLIAGSSLLDTYFEYFVDAISESSNLILFGYSGGDNHINNVIKRKLASDGKFSVEIIEWDKSERDENWWDNIFNSNISVKNSINVKKIENILNYDFSFLKE